MFLKTLRFSLDVVFQKYAKKCIFAIRVQFLSCAEDDLEHITYQFLTAKTYDKV